MGTETAVVAFFKKIFSVENAIENSEKRAVIRALRTIYFYPDDSIEALNQLIETEGRDVKALLTLQRLYGETSVEIDESINLLTSDSVRTNLNIPINVIKNIREATSRKIGIRACFTQMFFSTVLTGEIDRIVLAARRAKSEILELNQILESIELQMTDDKACLPLDGQPHRKLVPKAAEPPSESSSKHLK